MKKCLVASLERAVGNDDCRQRAQHQQHAAGGLPVNKLFQRCQDAIEGPLPGRYIDTFCHCGLRRWAIPKIISVADENYKRDPG